MNVKFPFPNRFDSRTELKRDIQYKKIPKEKIPEISDEAWSTGVQAAKNLTSEYPGLQIIDIMEQENIKLKRIKKDNIMGGTRFFSEYYSGRKEIILYEKSISLWAKENNMTDKEAERLILSHEFFHYLECSKIGLTSEQYKVPLIEMRNHTLGKAGIRALSEIGAHGFATTFYNITCN
jgi:hypothetical protein